jgi:hypothetical protein
LPAQSGDAGAGLPAQDLERSAGRQDDRDHDLPIRVRFDAAVDDLEARPGEARDLRSGPSDRFKGWRRRQAAIGQSASVAGEPYRSIRSMSRAFS